jgi:hypothetical protein
MDQSTFYKLIISQLVKKLPILYETQRFLTLITKACHLPLSQPDKSSPCPPIVFLNNSFSLLSSHLCVRGNFKVKHFNIFKTLPWFFYSLKLFNHYSTDKHAFSCKAPLLPTVTYFVCDGSIIDQNVNTTMFIFYEIMESFQTLLISHIQLMKPGLQTYLK